MKTANATDTTLRLGGADVQRFFEMPRQGPRRNRTIKHAYQPSGKQEPGQQRYKLLATLDTGKGQHTLRMAVWALAAPQATELGERAVRRYLSNSRDGSWRSWRLVELVAALAPQRT